mmetsp:Transcript_74098/g.130792  ORF Transcript_74098/g.130792 Transcript_74098/m.130792 type:complete len:274 (+) Transcript_74098:948-1769(+)
MQQYQPTAKEARAMVVRGGTTGMVIGTWARVLGPVDMVEKEARATMTMVAMAGIGTEVGKMTETGVNAGIQDRGPPRDRDRDRGLGLAHGPGRTKRGAGGLGPAPPPVLMRTAGGERTSGSQGDPNGTRRRRTGLPHCPEGQHPCQKRGRQSSLGSGGSRRHRAIRRIQTKSGGSAVRTARPCSAPSQRKTTLWPGPRPRWHSKRRATVSFSRSASRRPSSPSPRGSRRIPQMPSSSAIDRVLIALSGTTPKPCKMLRLLSASSQIGPRPIPG